jgi:hypothetical protein
MKEVETSLTMESGCVCTDAPEVLWRARQRGARQAGQRAQPRGEQRLAQPPAHFRLHRGHHLVLAARRPGQRRLDDADPGARLEMREHVPHRAIDMVGRQHLVAGREGQAAQHRVHARGGVLHEDRVLGRGAEEARERAGGLADAARRRVGDRPDPPARRRKPGLEIGQEPL